MFDVASLARLADTDPADMPTSILRLMDEGNRALRQLGIEPTGSTPHRVAAELRRRDALDADRATFAALAHDGHLERAIELVRSMQAEARMMTNEELARLTRGQSTGPLVLTVRSIAADELAFRLDTWPVGGKGN